MSAEPSRRVTVWPAWKKLRPDERRAPYWILVGCLAKKRRVAKNNVKGITKVLAEADEIFPPKHRGGG